MALHKDFPKVGEEAEAAPEPAKKQSPSVEETESNGTSEEDTS